MAGKKKLIENQYWQLLNRGKGTITTEMMAVQVCKYMNWDYYQYENQPAWFIELVTMKMNLEAEYHNKEQKQWQRKR